MNRPTLSVAMPNFNHAAYLPRAIESILDQSRPPDEFLILDDASTDQSAEIIESYARNHESIRFIRGERNVGVIQAHETLYRLATGDYLYSAAADDDRTEHFFELALDLAEQHPNAGLIFGKMVIVDQSGSEVGETGVRRWQESLFASPERYLSEFLEVEPAMQAMTGATIFRRAAFEEVGWCRAELGPFADTFAARAIALKYGACYIPEPFHIWHRQANSFSQESNANARQGMDVLARAVQLMRSEEFCDRFPEAHVRRWARRQRHQMLWTYLLGDDDLAAGARQPFWLRNLRRLPRAARAAALLFYQGDPNLVARS